MQNIIRKAFEDVLSRFLTNLSAEETAADRLFFHLEEAHWFYSDFHAAKNPALPKLTLKQFAHCMVLMQPSLLPRGKGVEQLHAEFQEYKSLIRVCGTIVFNEDMTKVLMVQPWIGQRWSFPRGKIETNETAKKCALREVAEECGFDATTYITDHYFEYREASHAVTMYIVLGVPENTCFQPKTRNEIRGVEWHDVNELPYLNQRASPCKRNMHKYKHDKEFFTSLAGWLRQYKPEQPQVTAQPSVSPARNQTPQDTIEPLPTFETNILAALAARGAKIGKNQITSMKVLPQERLDHSASRNLSERVLNEERPVHVPAGKSASSLGSPVGVKSSSVEYQLGAEAPSYSFKLNTADILSCFD